MFSYAAQPNLSPNIVYCYWKGFVWLWKGLPDRGHPRLTAGLSGKRRLTIHPFYFRWRSTKQLAQLPLSQSHLKIWVPWISGVDRGSINLQGQTYKFTLCIVCHGKDFPWCQESTIHHRDNNCLKEGLWESFPRSCNTKQLTVLEQGSGGLTKILSGLNSSQSTPRERQVRLWKWWKLFIWKEPNLDSQRGSAAEGPCCTEPVNKVPQPHW